MSTAQAAWGNDIRVPCLTTCDVVNVPVRVVKRQSRLDT